MNKEHLKIIHKILKQTFSFTSSDYQIVKDSAGINIFFRNLLLTSEIDDIVLKIEEELDDVMVEENPIFGFQTYLTILEL